MLTKDGVLQYAAKLREFGYAVTVEYHPIDSRRNLVHITGIGNYMTMDIHNNVVGTAVRNRVIVWNYTFYPASVSEDPLLAVDVSPAA